MANIKRDPLFYSKIGRKGGKNGTTGGFAQGEAGRERARKYGVIGGRISRRRPRVAPAVPRPNKPKSGIKTLISDVVRRG